MASNGILIRKKSKLVMIGDSITDCDRKKPIGEGLFDAAGHGYVANIGAILGAVYPDHPIRIVNMGLSGNTVRDLKTRWTTDVMDLKPDWLSIMIGTNDVWRQFDSPEIPEDHVQLSDFEAILDELVASTLPAVDGVILMTPFYIEPNRGDAMRARMDEYGAAVQRIARERQTLFIDTQAAFDRVLDYNYAATLSWDRVHPTQTGHLILARVFLDAIGFQWSR